ncbi:unnamed protein product [Agarophyton chilense]|eukprot:gb/GEZJ01000717.1/.p2 GENE.gb/GEZJ01000717.1/~~gb/GEZJ01000717.1/.p2  ORF type:complete len:415 (-),score=61.99 gb/GEZJ01000717.1/:4001-5245(-)
MIVEQHPYVLKQAPSQDLPRIFVGNLTAQISDAALRQLVSRFGTISDFERSKCSTFVHISLQTDAPSVNKCVASLNHVKWFGTSLRVERARQHYLHRLLDEWKQHTVDMQQLPKPSDQHEQIDSKPPFHNMPKGKHVRFSFPDDHFDKSVNTHVPISTANQQKKSINRPVSTKSSAFGSKQNSLQTTFSLFGLSGAPDGNQLISTKRSSPEINFSGQLIKRPRSDPVRNSENSEAFLDAQEDDAKHATNINLPKISLRAARNLDSLNGKDTVSDRNETYSIEKPEVVEEDPSNIDLEKERNTCLQVFRTMFVDEALPAEKSELKNPSHGGNLHPQHLLAHHRRAALYRTLQSPGVDARPLRTVKRTESISKSEIRSTPHDVFPQNHAQAAISPGHYRRAALYKKLQLVLHSDTV